MKPPLDSVGLCFVIQLSIAQLLILCFKSLLYNSIADYYVTKINVLFI